MKISLHNITYRKASLPPELLINRYADGVACRFDFKVRYLAKLVTFFNRHIVLGTILGLRINKFYI